MIGTYGKGLLHSQVGEVDLPSYRSMLHALTTQNHADFTNILLGYGRKLVNPGASFAYDLVGGDPHTFSIPLPPAFSSARAAADMVELYWQALARDAPFFPDTRGRATPTARSLRRTCFAGQHRGA